MKTFNNKPAWKNALAISLGVFGIVLLSIVWLYHMLVQLSTMPSEKWIDPFDSKNFPPKKTYPHLICKWFCNIENTLIHQLELLRTGFGTEYCDEENDE